MKALLESSISWSNIQKRPKENYQYYVRQATIDKETNILSLEVGLNFMPAKGMKHDAAIVAQRISPNFRRGSSIRPYGNSAAGGRGAAPFGAGAGY